MLKNIQLLRNIGTFNSDSGAATFELERVNLIYADNGRGKTTISAILRSLASGDSLPILERQRLGAQDPPHIVLNCEGQPANVMFQSGAWNRTLPDLRIFDDVFVNDNVYSGLDVDARHRQNLHELILGDQGVELNNALQDLVSRNLQHNRDLEEKEKLIPSDKRGGLTMDDFCGLSELPDVDQEIEATKLILKAARDQDDVRAAKRFELIALPSFDIDAIRGILLTDLPDLDEAAAAKVLEHIQTLGEGGEPWLADGVGRASDSGEDVCPFCGQNVKGLALITHYRAYFSQSYVQLKAEVNRTLNSIDSTHTDGIQAAFERAVGTVRQTRQFWANYCEVPLIELDTESIVTDWNAARNAAVQLLKAKQAAPLEPIEIDEETSRLLTKFNAHREPINAVNETLIASNELIRVVQERAESANSDEIRTKLRRLSATKARFSDEIVPLCDDYLQERQAKACTELERVTAREALVHYRTNIFPTLESGVNKYLEEFNAGFRIDSLAPSNIGGGSGSTCTYNVVINKELIAVRSANSPQGEPSFRNSLSSGDRNTLALALFFSSLDKNPNLGKATIVIDDPMSSLDDHRSLATVQAIQSLCERAGQIIVLSHNKSFLCNLWNGINREKCLPLEICQSGDESTIRKWDVNRDAITEHDQRHELLHEYAMSQSGDKQVVAAAIRPHLEGFLRVACAGNFPPGKLLGQFADECRTKLGRPDEILDEPTTLELKKLIDFGNPFHHEANSALQSQHNNATQLLGFVKRTLAFVGPPRV